MKQLNDTLQNLLQQAVDRQEIAGANLLVLQGGQELAFCQAGQATADRPFQRDTICRIFSMSKPVTAVAAMVLLQRGQLDAGQALEEILPAYSGMQVWEKGQNVPAERPIMIRDLLNMTSGICYPGMDEPGQEAARVFEDAISRLRGENPMTTRELADRLGGCTLAFQPGRQWMYGASADVLGAVIEQVSGMTLGEFMKREIFEPLQMHDTGFYVPPERQHRLAWAYRCGGGTPAHCPTDNLAICYDMNREPAFQSGGAGLVSTVDDYAKLASSLLGHGPQILEPATVRYMTAASLLPWQQESLWRSWDGMRGYGYGNLMRILLQPGAAVLNSWAGEYGWDGWLGTYFCNAPAQDVTVLLFTQRIDAGTLSLTRRVRNVLCAAL